VGATNPDRSGQRSGATPGFIGADTTARTPPTPTSRARAGPQLVSENSGHAQQLSRIVELEIIPRLLLMHSHAVAASRRTGVTITSAHVSTLAELAVDDDAFGVPRFLQALTQAGATPNQVLLELLGPCAALMGSWWCSDVFDFADVTIGMCRLQQALHEHVFQARPVLPSGAPSILVAAPPESQHTFGAAIAAECFAHAGWQAQYSAGLGWDALGGLLGGEFFDVLALSLSCDAQVASVNSGIVKLRQASCNASIAVLVGGPLALATDDLDTRCGADGMAISAGAAVELAERWLARMGRDRHSAGIG
jgi:methylmalonyl-CoA mutase cobalamin-binding subunit